MYMYISYFAFEVTSSAMVGLNAFQVVLPFLVKHQVGCSGIFLGTMVKCIQFGGLRYCYEKSYISYEKSDAMHYINWFFFLI